MGTVTDVDGRFVIPAAKGDKLVVSYVKMKTAKVKVCTEGNGYFKRRIIRIF